ncbi:DinB family protein [Alloacidobacterium sp.]|uniref:DinB family protein n=1 Tax=Alloacidobacterium sp. TaxID=2951999 RepID=UPI002D6DEC32|nr:DinB family protein [Alloacidobacterium sp.]HYK35649.1 DinB family protein [Alloacidobacterium sp.]
MTVVQSQIDHLSRQRELLQRALRDFGSEKFENRIPHKWSAREHFAHLARHQETYLSRIERILKEEKPALVSYTAETDAEWSNWVGLPLSEIETRWTAQRSALIEMLEKISPDQVHRIGVHSTLGELTLIEWLDFFLVHEGHHLLAILKLIRGRTS